MTCPCHSQLPYSACCEPFHKGTILPPSALQLMRSRYAAYSLNLSDYIWDTTYPKDRKYTSKASISKWSTSNHWIRLEILDFDDCHVHFKAYYHEKSTTEIQIHEEYATFIYDQNRWYFRLI